MTDRLEHSALGAAPGRPLVEADLSDRERLGAVVQIAALGVHLARAGWRLDDDLATARVDDDGRVVGVRASPGVGRRSVQSVARRSLRRLFAPNGGEVSGKGQARRIARELDARWGAALVPLPPDRVVENLLDASPFLWEPRFSPAREALTAEVAANGSAEIRVCGPTRFARSVLDGAGNLEEVRRRLADGDVAKAAWEGEVTELDDPVEAMRAERWAAAVTAWSASTPTKADERVAFGEALFHVGRFDRALELIGELSTPAARLLAARCHFFANRPKKAASLLGRLDPGSVGAEALLDHVDLAARAFAAADTKDGAGPWREAAAAVGADEGGWRTALFDAGLAWDRGDADGMAEALARAEADRDDEVHGWRWHHQDAHRHGLQGDGAAMEVGLRRAFAWRRRLDRVESAALWNDLALARVIEDDLPGAERACAHAARLQLLCDGDRATVLALRNLAEVRVRRGRTRGVEETIERALSRSRLAGNRRAWAQDAGLMARFELVEGRYRAAAATCEQMLDRLDEAGESWHRDELSVVLARARGWSGDSDGAARALGGVGDEAVRAMLEPEERPGLWVLAGEADRAIEWAEDGACGDLWRAALEGRDPARDTWRAVRELEPYRAARLVWDLELASPGLVPAAIVRRAVGVLRSVGARRMASRLEARVGGSWEVLARFLRRAEPAAADVRELFAGIGQDGARLVRSGSDGERSVLDGRGGPLELLVPRADGSVLVATTDRLDPVFEVAVRLVAERGAIDDGAEADGGATVLPGIVGRSDALLEALEMVPLLAEEDVPVLVLGESGTGKELVASQLHRLSPRSSADLNPVNCAALSENLVLSELFGHARGAFTGADRDRPGVFEAAQGGTVFLDEIGDLPPVAQGMLLRVLQEREVRRLGENRPRKVDFRVVTATHRNLAEMVSEGSFRQDLYYRLRVGIIELPPLRDRGDDVTLLARHLLTRFRPGTTSRFTEAALRRLRRHAWPGNIRELANVVQISALRARGGPIEAEHLDLGEGDDGSGGTVPTYAERVLAFRREIVTDALRATGGNRPAAAKRLGMTRQSLAYLIKSLEIEEE